MEGNSSQRRRITNLREIDSNELDFGKNSIVGEGAFGIVHKASWNGREVAVKKLRALMNRGDSQWQEFWREVEILNQISNHSCVVEFVGVTSFDNPTQSTWALITEFVQHGSVEDLLIKKALDVPDVAVLNMAFEAAHGLQHLHNSNVIHRDLAARNLLVTTRNNGQYHALVSDFGLSRVKDAWESKGFTLSTTRPYKWSAPEVLVPDQERPEYFRYSASSDVFSYGVVLYEMFARESPWKNVDAFDAAYRVKNGERMPLPPRILPAVKQLVQKCWEHEPRDRPSLLEILSLLQSILESTRRGDRAPSNLNAFASNTFRTSQPQNEVKSDQPYYDWVNAIDGTPSTNQSDQAMEQKDEGSPNPEDERMEPLIELKRIAQERDEWKERAQDRDQWKKRAEELMRQEAYIKYTVSFVFAVLCVIVAVCLSISSRFH